LHVVLGTALNFSEYIALITLESYACKCMDVKQLWGEERQVVVVPLPRSVVSPSGEYVWLTHASAWLVVKCEVEAR
jgi:hypothetical protein